MLPNAFTGVNCIPSWLYLLSAMTSNALVAKSQKPRGAHNILVGRSLSFSLNQSSFSRTLHWHEIRVMDEEGFFSFKELIIILPSSILGFFP